MDTRKKNGRKLIFWGLFLIFEKAKKNKNGDSEDIDQNFRKIFKKKIQFFFWIFKKKIKLFRCIVEFQGLITIKKIEKNEFFWQKTLFLTVFGHFDPKKGQKPRNLHKHHLYSDH